MVIRELAALGLLGLAAAVPIGLWRARFGHWRVTRVAELTDGARVKVGGTVELAGAPLRPPGVAVDCAAYSLWRDDVADDEASDQFRSTDFVVRDRAGDAVLVPAGERGYLQGGRHAVHVGDDGLVDVRFVLPGDAVFVVGVAERVVTSDGEGATYREPPRRWQLTAGADAPLAIVSRSLRR